MTEPTLDRPALVAAADLARAEDLALVVAALDGLRGGRRRPGRGPGDDARLRRRPPRRPVAHLRRGPLHRLGARGRRRRPSGCCVLLHTKLQQWLQPGGHARRRRQPGRRRPCGRPPRRRASTACGSSSPPSTSTSTRSGRRPSPPHLHLDVRFVVLAPPEADGRGQPRVPGAAVGHARRSSTGLGADAEPATRLTERGPGPRPPPRRRRRPGAPGGAAQARSPGVTQFAISLYLAKKSIGSVTCRLSFSGHEEPGLGVVGEGRRRSPGGRRGRSASRPATPGSCGRRRPGRRRGRSARRRTSMASRYAVGLGR